MKPLKPIIVIVAGGLAIRMLPITETIPKCLIDIDGKPLIQYQIEFFQKKGFTEIIFCIAHLAGMVKGYFGDGKKFGVNIRYSEEPKELLGTAGAVGLIKNMIKDTLIVYYGDNLTTMDFDELVAFHKKEKSDFTIVIRDLPPNYKSSSIIILDEKKNIISFIEKPSEQQWEEYKNHKKYINSGIYVVEPEVLKLIPENKKYDFAKELIPDLMSKGRIVKGFVSNNFFREIGRVEKYEHFKQEIKKKGEVLEEINEKKAKAVFLDRDGVIIENAKNGVKPGEIRLMPGAGKAIAKLNQAGYKTIVVTNQPEIAKGFITFEQVNQANEQIKKLIAKDKAHLDAFYICPHHPEKGFEGEIKELKIDCDCRKPKPGMLLKAAKEHNLDLKESWIVGDSKSDIKAGQAAGVKTILVISGGGSGSKHEKELENITPDNTAKDLSDAVKII
jgi:mannose-1-phosphate guanylyltransferase/phosphomannomutase